MGSGNYESPCIFIYFVDPRRCRAQLGVLRQLPVLPRSRVRKLNLIVITTYECNEIQYHITKSLSISLILSLYVCSCVSLCVCVSVC